MLKYREKTASKPGRWIKCPYFEGVHTGNSTIKDWFDTPDGQQISLGVLKDKKPAEKVKGYRRIAYQIHEHNSEFCARSYEDALILANPDKFGLVEGSHWGDLAWEMAKEMPKIETALRFAIKTPVWNVPLYLKEGLIWLSEPPPPPPVPPLPGEGA